MNKFTFYLLVILFSSVNAVGQEAAPKTTGPVLRTGVDANKYENFLVGDVRGTVKSKAVYLAKPDYPDEARETGEEGTVRVQITIDNEGNVSKAVALSGNPLLTNVSERAALQSKFRIARNESDHPVEADGTLVYTFEIRKAGWSRIAYGLAGLEMLPVSTFSIPTALKAMDPEWTKERQMFEKLDEIRRAEPPLPRSPVLVRTPIATRSTARLPNGAVSRSSGMRGLLTVHPPPSAEQKALTKELISALQNRLANDELNSWQFGLGLQLRTAIEQYRNPFERRNASAIVKRTIESAPGGVSPEVLATLKTLEASFAREESKANSLDEIARSYSVILGGK